MNNKLVLGAVLAVVLLAVGVGYFMGASSDDNDPIEYRVNSCGLTGSTLADLDIAFSDDPGMVSLWLDGVRLEKLDGTRADFVAEPWALESMPYVVKATVKVPLGSDIDDVMRIEARSYSEDLVRAS